MSKNLKQVDRRSFIGDISKAGVFGTLASLLPGTSSARILDAYSADPDKGHIFLSEPYLQAPSANSITLRWITNKLCYSWINYGEKETRDNKAHRVTDGLVDAYNRINEITLEGLKPDTKYYYQVHSKEIIHFKPYSLEYGETISSPVFSFTTPGEAPDTVSWLVLNDIHDRPASIPHLIDLNGSLPYDYVFYNGDMFDYQTDEQQIIDHLIQPSSQSFASSKPFMFVRGNHETRGKFSRDLPNYFSNIGGKHYFAYEWGPVYNLVLDTGEDKPDDHPVYAGIVDFDQYRRGQARWAEKIMSSEAFRQAKFRVVMMHIPPYHSGDWHGTLHCREVFAPLFEKYKVDLVISGHTHKHGIWPASEEHPYPVVIGGGPQAGNRTLIRLQAGQKDLHLKMLLDNGTEVGKLHLTK